MMIKYVSLFLPCKTSCSLRGRSSSKGVVETGLTARLGESLSPETSGLEMWYPPAPLIHKFPDEKNIAEGESVLIKVSVEGNPKPILTWFTEGQELTLDKTIDVHADGSLYIPRAQLKHNGQYKLLAKNSAGTAERSFILNVKLRELRRLMTLNNSSLLKPVPVNEFGEHVADNHHNDNKGFKNQFSVAINYIIFSQLKYFLMCSPCSLANNTPSL